MEEKISKEDVAIVQAYLAKSETAVAQARAVVAEMKTAELEYRNQILRVYIKYGMSLEDQFDSTTGVITKKVKEDVKETTVEETATKES